MQGSEPGGKRLRREREMGKTQGPGILLEQTEDPHEAPLLQAPEAPRTGWGV